MKVVQRSGTLWATLVCTLSLILTLDWKLCGNTKPPYTSFCNLSTWWVEVMIFFIFCAYTSRQFSTFPHSKFFSATSVPCCFSQGDVCGLCGNFNENGKDDFTTQGNLLTTNKIEFVDSWKVASQCLEENPDFNPCFNAPRRFNFANVQCGIIKGVMFQKCHNTVQIKKTFQ